MSQREATIREADNGYILKLQSPYGSYSNNGEVVCKTWREAMKKLREAFLSAEKDY